MESINVLRDSIETSVHLKLFKSLEEASYAHTFKSKLKNVPLSVFKNVDNFDPARFSANSYPANNSPRKGNDLKSVHHTIKQIQNDEEIPPIWLYKKGSKYTLLDGAHRLVAHYKQNMKTIRAYVIS
jgi:hypothetical protein